MSTIRFASLILLVLAACNGDGGPAGTDPSDFRGTYQGTWTLRATETSTGLTVEVSCPGSFTISSHTGSTFSGSLIVQSTQDCDAASEPVQGTLGSDGSLTIEVGDIEPFEDLTGCVVISGDDDFEGSVSGSNLSFDASLTTDCDTETGVVRILWTIEFDGSR